MRIAYICNRYPAISMTFVHREVEGLRSLGVDVRTLSIRPVLPGDLLAAEDREAALSTYSVLPPRWTRLLRAHARALATRPSSYLRTLAYSLQLSSGGLRARLWRVFYFAEAIAVWERCRKDEIRHLHSHFANVATDVAMLCARFADRPGERWSWSFTLHGPVEFYDVYRAQLSEKIGRARFVVCISDFARSQAMAWSDQAQWSKLHVVHCGVDPVEWRPVSPPANSRETPPGVRVLCVGRLISLKGHAVLIESIARLRADGLDVAVTLVGDGAARGTLEELARRRAVTDLVEFAGAIGQDRIREHFARADVFCLPSFAEGVPVVLMEAMAMELAVVSTPVMGIPELVESEVSGLLTPPGRSDELAAGLRRLSADRELRERLGRAGRAKVLASYDIARSAERLAGLLRRYRVEGADVDVVSPALAPPQAPVGQAPSESASTPWPFSPAREDRCSPALQNAGPPPGSEGAGA